MDSASSLKRELKTLLLLEGMQLLLLLLPLSVPLPRPLRSLLSTPTQLLVPRAPLPQISNGEKDPKVCVFFYEKMGRAGMGGEL